MRDTFNCAVKVGLLGQILHDMVIRTMLKEIFDYRKTTLESMFKTAANPHDTFLNHP